MPKRRRTREQDRAHRIDCERALNAAHVAERNLPPPFYWSINGLCRGGG